jgi:murein DD-endopeptidase MepM/ murein hydrolase activator NlpD
MWTTMTNQLRLYYPLRPHKVNQRWGDNAPCVRDFGLETQSIVSGVDNYSCPVGYEKLYPKFGMEGHNGLDLAAWEQPIYAALDGIVIEKQGVPARGLGIGVLSDEQYDFGTFGTHFIKIRYWHLKSFNCEVGDRIKVGDVLGITDNTGYSSGNHLHFEGQPMDKDAGGHPLYPVLPTSITGTIDIEPYFTGIYADTVQQQINLYTQLVGLLQMLLDKLKSK